MRPFTLISMVLMLLGSRVQAAPNRGDVGPFERHNTEALSCDRTYLDPIKRMQAADRQMWARGLGSMRLLNAETLWTDNQLNALGQCQVDADTRLKSQLWGDVPDIPSPGSQAPPSWVEIASDNYKAVMRYDHEAKDCSNRYLEPVNQAVTQGPQPKKAGDQVFNWRGRILGEALDQVEKCDIEAAARLKAQLRSQ